MVMTANELLKELLEFAALVKEREGHVSSEVDTRTFLINPFLKKLGWDVDDFKSKACLQEYPVDLAGGQKKVDYALFDEEQKLAIVVEAKAANVSLDDQKIFNQLNGYFAHSTAIFGIITNGSVYRWYIDDEEAVGLKAVPSIEFDARNPTMLDAEFLTAFYRKSFERSSARKTANEIEVQSYLISWFKATLKKPTENFTKWLIKDIGIHQPTLRIPKILNQSRIKAYQRTISSALDKFAEDKSPGVPRRPVSSRQIDEGKSEEKQVADPNQSDEPVECELRNGKILRLDQKHRAYWFEYPGFIRCDNGMDAFLALLTCFARQFPGGATSFVDKLSESFKMFSSYKRRPDFRRYEIAGKEIWARHEPNEHKRRVVGQVATWFEPPLLEEEHYGLWIPTGTKRKTR